MCCSTSLPCRAAGPAAQQPHAAAAAPAIQLPKAAAQQPSPPTLAALLLAVLQPRLPHHALQPPLGLLRLQRAALLLAVASGSAPARRRRYAHNRTQPPRARESVWELATPAHASSPAGANRGRRRRGRGMRSASLAHGAARFRLLLALPHVQVIIRRHILVLPILALQSMGGCGSSHRRVSRAEDAAMTAEEREDAGSPSRQLAGGGRGTFSERSAWSSSGRSSSPPPPAAAACCLRCCSC